MSFLPFHPRRLATLAAFVALLSAGPLGAQSSLDEVIRREAASTEATSVQGKDNWRFLRAELRHLAAISAPDFALKPATGPLQAITEFQKALADRSIRLVLVPIPEKARIRCDQLAGGIKPDDAQPLDKAAAALYDQLKKAGIDVLDLTAAFRAEVAKGADPGYCRTDSHFTPRFCELTAAELAKTCQAALPDLAKTAGPTTAVETTITITGDLAAAGDSETLKSRQISQQGGGLIEPAERSPVLLLGDSHCLIFHAGGDMLASGTGLSDHLTAVLGTAPAVVGVRGGGATASRVNLYRKAAKDKAFLPATKIVLWCLAARDLTQAVDWKPVPLPK